MLSKLIVVSLLLIPLSASAYQVIKGTSSADELAKRADHAFYGTCVGEKVEASTRSALGAGRTEYTFKIINDLMGNLGGRRTFTYKQVGAPDTARWMHKYNCGGQMEYIVFLSCNPDSGFCGPVGLRAKWDVIKDASGQWVISGDIGSAELFSGLLKNPVLTTKYLTSQDKEVVSRTQTQKRPLITRDEAMSVFKSVFRYQAETRRQGGRR